MKRIRISVNLIHYFQDHRQLVKIFVKNDMETIEDLHKHIIKLFKIDKNFYLMCQNHYIPSEEDIRVLNDNDTIYIIPNLNTCPGDETFVKRKKKKNLIDMETNTEVNLEEKTKKKKKQKSTGILETVESCEKNKNDVEKNEETNSTEKEMITKKKKKRPKQIESMEQVRQKSAEKITNKSSQLINEELMETSNIVETDNNIEVPKKKKRVNSEPILQENKSKVAKNIENYSSHDKNDLNCFEERNEIINNGTPSKNNVNETVIFRPSNKFDSIFTHQNEVTEIEFENNSEYNFVSETRRKRRRCITPPVILFEKESELEENLETNTINENPKKSIVRTVEHISPNEHNELLKNIQHSPRQSYSLADVLHFKNQTSSPATNEVTTILEKSNRPVLKTTRKQLSGVGKVLEFIKTEQESDVSENNESVYPVPKRKRIRTRKRKTKNTDSPSESNEHSDQSVFVPPKTIAAPKVHIKFEENLDTNANSMKDEHLLKLHPDHSESQNGFAHSTPHKTLETARKSENFYDPSRMSIIDINTDELPLMIETPNVNNLIIFKKLKLGPDYNPTISNNILAKIMQIAKNGDELHLKILEGHEELEGPVGGRFSFNTEDEEDYDYDKVQIMERNSLIDPKIVNDFQSQ